MRITKGTLLSAVLVLSAACMTEKDEAKGLVDEGTPPAGNPVDSGPGKADDGGRVIAIDLQSPHPYTDNLDQIFEVPLAGVLPSCAYRVRLHFAVLRTEPGYDYVTVRGAVGEELQRFDGVHDDTWTQWILVDATAPRVEVGLETDYSIVRHGFEIDGFEWDGGANCPRVPYPACPEGTIDITSPPAECECWPLEPTCVAYSDLELRYNLYRGFDNTGKRLLGTEAYSVGLGPADELVDTRIGTVAEPDFRRVIEALTSRGLFDAPGYSGSGEWTEYFSIRAGDRQVTFTAPRGEHTPEVAAAIAAFHAAFECGYDERISCAAGYTCSSETHQCVEESSCVCTTNYDPVCAVNGRTYSNACYAGCDDVPVAHPGECGITGDTCGTILGLTCQADFKCRWGDSGFGTPYPDEAGSCVPIDACEAPEHCEGLIHPAVPGVWACIDETCSWQAGPEWQPVPDFQFATSHPYPDNAAEWQQLYLPAGATAMRLVPNGDFELEQGYDFLEVWSWQDGAWRKVTSYTGTDGPDGHPFDGRYHYLHFVSDYSITGHGFELTAQYKN